MCKHEFGSADYVLDKIRCPQFGDAVYGEWGALRLDQRKALRILAEHDKRITAKCDELMRKLMEATNNE